MGLLYRLKRRGDKPFGEYIREQIEKRVGTSRHTRQEQSSIEKLLAKDPAFAKEGSFVR